MIELRFRAIENGKYIYSFKYVNLGFYFYDTIDCKQEQFTGLTDKFGIHIYEGDILQIEDRIIRVVWDSSTASFDTVFVRKINKLTNYNSIRNQEWEFRAEVIGNINDNKDLL